MEKILDICNIVGLENYKIEDGYYKFENTHNRKDLNYLIGLWLELYRIYCWLSKNVCILDLPLFEIKLKNDKEYDKFLLNDLSFSINGSRLTFLNSEQIKNLFNIEITTNYLDIDKCMKFLNGSINCTELNLYTTKDKKNFEKLIPKLVNIGYYFSNSKQKILGVNYLVWIIFQK